MRKFIQNIQLLTNESRSDIAKKLNITHQKLTDYINCKIKVNSDILLKIVDVYPIHDDQNYQRYYIELINRQKSIVINIKDITIKQQILLFYMLLLRNNSINLDNLKKKLK